MEKPAELLLVVAKIFFYTVKYAVSFHAGLEWRVKYSLVVTYLHLPVDWTLLVDLDMWTRVSCVVLLVDHQWISVSFIVPEPHSADHQRESSLQLFLIISSLSRKTAFSFSHYCQTLISLSVSQHLQVLWGKWPTQFSSKFTSVIIHSSSRRPKPVCCS